jgi:hypothetical protein
MVFGGFYKVLSLITVGFRGIVEILGLTKRRFFVRQS